mgnify:CR=1 FL=1
MSKQDKEMSFLDHLEIFRWHLIRAAAAIMFFAIIAFISDSTYGILAGTVRQWLASDLGRLVFMRRFGGSVMIGLGLFTIATAVFTA